MELFVFHRTRYDYAGGAAFDSHNEARLMPITDETQVCESFSLSVGPPAKVTISEQSGGRVHHFHVYAPHDSLVITAEARVRTLLKNPFERMNFHYDDRAFYDDSLRSRECEWLLPSPRVPLSDPLVVVETDALGEAAQASQVGAGAAWFPFALNKIIRKFYAYDPDATEVSTTLQEAIRRRAGVCQDYAHLMIAVLRRQGIPARYVSGYLRTDGGWRTGDMMHAWVECLLPAPGGGIWRGFDPTNDMVANENYVIAHRGRDYGDITPLRGIYYGPPGQKLSVEVRVGDTLGEVALR